MYNFYFLLKILNKFFLGFLCKKKDIIFLMGPNETWSYNLDYQNHRIISSKVVECNASKYLFIKLSKYLIFIYLESSS